MTVSSRWFSTLVLAWLCAAPGAIAQTVDSAGIAAASDGSRDVNVEADNMEVLEAEKKAIFTGNVNGERAGTRFSGDRMVIHYSEAKRDDGTSKTQVTRVDVTGNVKIVTAAQTITGDAANLDLKSDILTVSGDVRVVQGRTVINGTTLKVNLKTKTSAMTGGRVKGSFVPGGGEP
jgi:lipopolysaccharide export system protein LptA